MTPNIYVLYIKWKKMAITHNENLPKKVNKPAKPILNYNKPN